MLWCPQELLAASPWLVAQPGEAPPPIPQVGPWSGGPTPMQSLTPSPCLAEQQKSLRWLRLDPGCRHLHPPGLWGKGQTPAPWQEWCVPEDSRCPPAEGEVQVWGLWWLRAP